MARRSGALKNLHARWSARGWFVYIILFLSVSTAATSSGLGLIWLNSDLTWVEGYIIYRRINVVLVWCLCFNLGCDIFIYTILLCLGGCSSSFIFIFHLSLLLFHKYILLVLLEIFNLLYIYIWGIYGAIIQPPLIFLDFSTNTHIIFFFAEFHQKLTCALPY